MNQKDLLASSALIIKDFHLEESSLEIKTERLTYDLLVHKLTGIVNYLLEKDFNRLLNTLYRIDVSEDKLKFALANENEHPANAIARLIIDRELQKVEIRKKYS